MKATKETVILLHTQRIFKCFSFSLILLYFSGVIGCATAGKDIHFRSRLPTQELPLLIPSEDKSKGIGFDIDLENSRFTVQPTNNLVTNYNVNGKTAYFSSNRSTINGTDFSLNYRELKSFGIFKIAASGDFIEITLAPKQQISEKYFLNINGGVYKTTSYISTGSGDCFFCSGTEDAALKESTITVSHGGTERKMGGLIGYNISDNYFLTISYQWMNYSYTANVKKPSSQELIYDEGYFGQGYGLGIYSQASQRLIVGATLDQVDLFFREDTWKMVLVGIRLGLYF